MSMTSISRIDRLVDLRALVREIEVGAKKCNRAWLPFGIEAMDRRLEGGGLAIAALHEIIGANMGLADDAAACLFVAGIAARRSATVDRPVLWTLARRDLFAPALAQAGLTPDRLIYAEGGCDEDILAVMEEGLRHGGLAAVVGEVGRAAMSATRRLQLAAEEGGTTALMLRRWRKSGSEPFALPSAAVTRWQIACAPSTELPVPGVGRARWRIRLARQRGGAPHEWIVESPDAEGRLALPASSSYRSAATGRSGERHAA